MVVTLSLSAILNLVTLPLLAVLAFFLKRLVTQLDSLTTKVQDLNVHVAVILDRDRKQRLEDYKNEA